MISEVEMYTHLVDRYVNYEEFDVLGEITADIKQDKFSLLTLVESLGSALSSSNVKSRALGTKMLAETLHLIPHSALLKQEVVVLTKFIEERFKDHHTVTPHLLKATVALVQTRETSDEQIHILLRAIFREIHVQSLLQGERYHMYSLVEYLLIHRTTALQDIGADFLMGYIQTMDGEKDPRNLLVAFRCVKMIAGKLVLGAFTEDLFEMVACYFPVDFTPPSNDMRGVTKEDLANGLMQCFAANKDFAEFCLPLMLEKLSATMSSAKIDCFRTLTVCASIYQSKLPEYMGSIWASIRREVFSLQNESVEVAALSALTAVVCGLSAEVISDNNCLRSFIAEALQETKNQLLVAEILVAPPCGRLLRSIMAGSLSASIQVLQALVPAIVDKILQGSQVSKKKLLLEELTLMLKQAEPELVDRVLGSFRLETYECYVSLLSQENEDMVCASIRGLRELVRLSGMLTADQYTNSSQHLQRLALSTNKGVRLLALDTLQAMANHLSDATVQSLVEFMWSSVLNVQTDSNTDSKENSKAVESLSPKQDAAFDGLTAISSCGRVANLSVPLIIERLQSYTTTELKNESSGFTESLCIHLKTILQQTAGQPECGQYYWDVLRDQICKLCVVGACDVDSRYARWDTLHLLHGCVRLILCGQRHRSLDNIVESVIGIFLDWNLGSYETPTGLQTLNVDSPGHQTYITGLVSAVVSSVPADFTIPRHSEVLDKLLDFSLGCPHVESATTAAMCLAAVLNKQPTEGSLVGVESSITSTLEDSSCRGTDKARRSVVLLVWITKALLLCGHQQQKHWTDKLLSLLSDPNLGVQAAQGFSTVLDDCEDVLTVDTAARVLFMYKQRFFVMTVDILLGDFRKLKSDGQTPYLLAVAHLLKDVPKEVTDPYLPQLLPLTVQCLHQEGALSSSLWLAGLKMMLQMTTNWPDLVSKHVDDIISVLLQMAMYRDDLHVRLRALECLQKLTGLPSSKLIPHQPTVIRKLVQPLNDHKRLVRREAVLAREKWILLASPGVH